MLWSIIAVAATLFAAVINFAIRAAGHVGAWNFAVSAALAVLWVALVNMRRERGMLIFGGVFWGLSFLAGGVAMLGEAGGFSLRLLEVPLHLLTAPLYGVKLFLSYAESGLAVGALLAAALCLSCALVYGKEYGYAEDEAE